MKLPWKKTGREMQTKPREHPVSLLQSEMSDLIDRFFREPWGGLSGLGLDTVRDWAPSLDVSETERSVQRGQAYRRELMRKMFD